MVAREPKGLCVNCAVHDWLRNTYPVNMLLAKSGPKALAYPHIREQFANIMRIGMADAAPEEIDWDTIIKNWGLPFKTKVKPRPGNPCSQNELKAITKGTRPGFGERGGDFNRRRGPLTITSFEQLNELEPGSI